LRLDIQVPAGKGVIVIMEMGVPELVTQRILTNIGSDDFSESSLADLPADGLFGDLAVIDGPHVLSLKGGNELEEIIIADMSFYTRKGDDGYTGVLGEGRIPKEHPRTEALGAIDEATSALGLARASARAPKIAPIILQVQRDLYRLMAEVAATPENVEKFRAITEAKVTWVEEQTDSLSRDVRIPGEFIIPGDTQASAALDLARTIVRRAERKVAELYHIGEIDNAQVLNYLNRLSSLCFVLELYEDQFEGQSPTLAKG